MLRYRRLNTEELLALEDEFVKFLASQSISAPDWVKIKTENKTRESELIDLFSNLVMDKVLSDIKYLELVTQDEIKVFHMSENSGRLLGLSIKSKDINLSDDSQLNKLFSEPEKLISLNPKIYSLEKKYTKPKAEECFFLINLGATITNDSIYKVLDSMVVKGNSKNV